MVSSVLVISTMMSLASEVRVPQNRTSELLEGPAHKLREVILMVFLGHHESYSEGR